MVSWLFLIVTFGGFYFVIGVLYFVIGVLYILLGTHIRRASILMHWELPLLHKVCYLYPEKINMLLAISSNMVYTFILADVFSLGYSTISFVRLYLRDQLNNIKWSLMYTCSESKVLENFLLWFRVSAIMLFTINWIIFIYQCSTWCPPSVMYLVLAHNVQIVEILLLLYDVQ